MDQSTASSLTIEIKMNRTFDSFGPGEQERLVIAPQDLLPSAKSIGKKMGSVSFTLQISAEHAETLLWATGAGEFARLVEPVAAINARDSSVGVKRPSVFIGSSKEGLIIAEALQANMDEYCEVTLWSQGAFGLGEGNLEALVRLKHEFDFAILVLTADDLTVSRGKPLNSPRDNVLLELGLFIGSIGRDRTFAIYDRTAPIKLPSDLAGVSLVAYSPHSSGNYQSALGGPCFHLKQAIKHLGPRNRLLSTHGNVERES